MRLVRSPVLFLALSGFLGLAACGGGDDDDDSPGVDAGDGGGEPDAGVTGDDHTYVLDSLLVPTTGPEADTYGVDVDGDDNVDNALGTNLATVATFVDIKAAVTGQIDQGGIILLANLQASDLATATGAGLSVYLGADPNPPACASEADTVCRGHLQGGATFNISENSPDDALVVGDIAGGHFSGGPGEVVIELSLSALAEPLRIRLVNARVETDVSAEGLTEGRLGGAITAEDADTEIVPGLAALINSLLEDCTGPGGKNPPCGCDDDLETVRGFFEDEEGDCQISVEEARNSAATRLLLSPDLDLFDASGNPGTDGEEDAISLGVGFTAVPGTFTVP